MGLAFTPLVLGKVNVLIRAAGSTVVVKFLDLWPPGTVRLFLPCLLSESCSDRLTDIYILRVLESLRKMNSQVTITWCNRDLAAISSFLVPALSPGAPQHSVAAQTPTDRMKL